MSIVKWLDKNFEYICLAALLMVMTILSFTNVVMRYCFHNALSWSDEACCFCLALSAFFCLPCSIRARTAIRVDTFVTVLPDAVKKILNYACHIIMIVFLVFCFQGGLAIAAKAALLHQKSPALQIPIAVFYNITIFCFGLSILRSIQVLLLDLIGKKKGES